MPGSSLYGVRELMSDLRKLQPDLAKELRAKAKAPAKPLVSKIKARINRIKPLSGMRTKGRLGWGNGKKADHTLIKFSSGYSRTRATTSLVSIWVDSPMTSVAEVAGKGGMRKAKTVTKSYPYKGGSRTHRINGGNGGDEFVLNLKKHDMNNFIYPTVESALPDVEREIKLVIKDFEKKLNRKFN